LGNHLECRGKASEQQAHPRSTIVQLNGAANIRTSGRDYVGGLISKFAEAFEANVQLFQVPAFFDFAETRNAMWNERSIARVLDFQRRADIALFSIGAITGRVPNHVYSGGYLEKEDIEILNDEEVVGDVCTVFFRADGTYEDLSLNQRATGPTPKELKRIPIRVCAVPGDNKVIPLLAALRAGVITHLVIDEQTATKLVAQIDASQDQVEPSLTGYWCRARKRDQSIKTLELIGEPAAWLPTNVS